jgi:hypothetical protein
VAGHLRVDITIVDVRHEVLSREGKP